MDSSRYEGTIFLGFICWVHWSLPPLCVCFHLSLCLRVCWQTGGAGEGVEHSQPTALAVVPVLCQCCVLRNLLLLAWALLGRDSSAAGGQGLGIHSRNTSWVWNKAMVLAKFQICQQIFALLTNAKLGVEEALQFVQQLPALRVF